MKIQLRSPDRILLEKENIQSFSASLVDGRSLTILPQHAPLLALLKAGPVVVKDQKSQESITLDESILKFRDDQIILYVQNDLPVEKDEQ